MIKPGCINNHQEAKEWYVNNYYPNGYGIPGPFLGGGFYMAMLINGDAPNDSIRKRYSVADMMNLREYIDHSTPLC